MAEDSGERPRPRRQSRELRRMVIPAVNRLPGAGPPRCRRHPSGGTLADPHSLGPAHTQTPVVEPGNVRRQHRLGPHGSLVAGSHAEQPAGGETRLPSTHRSTARSSSQQMPEQRPFPQGNSASRAAELAWGGPGTASRRSADPGEPARSRVHAAAARNTRAMAARGAAMSPEPGLGPSAGFGMSALRRQHR
jgi:hypothetical protein